VLHDWDDGQVTQILQACRNAMRPGGRVLIAQRLIPRIRAMPSTTVLPSDLNMLLVSGGQERTSTECGTLLTAAGLQPGRVNRSRRRMA
jgi:hypothetical protein